VRSLKIEAKAEETKTARYAPVRPSADRQAKIAKQKKPDTVTSTVFRHEEAIKPP
jgi:hypothetical protein